MGQFHAGVRGFLGAILAGVTAATPVGVDATIDRSLTPTGAFGLFQTKSAPPLVPLDYQFISTLSYFRQRDLFEDSSTREIVKRTGVNLAFNFVPFEFLSTNAYLKFSNTTIDNATTSSGETSLSSLTLHTGLESTAMIDLHTLIATLPKETIQTGLDLIVELSAIRRFFKAPLIHPSWILSLGLGERKIPFRFHLNLGLQMKSQNRYLAESDQNRYDRFATHATPKHAFVPRAALEFPFKDYVASVEYGVELLGGKFLDNPQTVTAGLKATPLPFKNIIFLLSGEFGLSSHVRDSTVPAVPLWTVLGGINIQGFARTKGSVTVSEAELLRLERDKNRLNAQLKKIEQDVNYNLLSGTVRDSVTKNPIPGARIHFPNAPQLKELESGPAGQFERYYPSFGSTLMMVSKPGFGDARKFLTLKPGETATIEIELSRDSGGLSDAALSLKVVNEANEPVNGLVRIRALADETDRQFETGESGELSRPLPPGRYRIQVTAPGYQPQELTLDLEPEGRAIRQLRLVKSNR